MHFITRMFSLQLYITTCHARDGVSDTPEHSNHIYLLNSSLIGDPDAVAWLRAARCTGTRPHRASQAAIACTASLHRTPPFQAAKSKAFLVLSGRGAAVALVALRQDLGTLLCSHGSCADVWTKTAACGRTVPRAHAAVPLDFAGAHTMSAAIATKNKRRTRVERREKPPISLPPLTTRSLTSSKAVRSLDSTLVPCATALVGANANKVGNTLRTQKCI